MTELVFLVEDAPEGGYTARALGVHRAIPLIRWSRTNHCGGAYASPLRDECRPCHGGHRLHGKGLRANCGRSNRFIGGPGEPKDTGPLRNQLSRSIGR